MRCCIASSTTSRLTDKHNQVSLAPQSNRRRWAAFGPPNRHKCGGPVWRSVILDATGGPADVVEKTRGDRRAPRDKAGVRLRRRALELHRGRVLVRRPGRRPAPLIDADRRARANRAAIAESLRLTHCNRGREKPSLCGLREECQQIWGYLFLLRSSLRAIVRRCQKTRSPSRTFARLR
jgi:hypothetical protein